MIDSAIRERKFCDPRVTRRCRAGSEGGRSNSLASAPPRHSWTASRYTHPPLHTEGNASLLAPAQTETWKPPVRVHAGTELLNRRQSDGDGEAQSEGNVTLLGRRRCDRPTFEGV